MNESLVVRRETHIAAPARHRLRLPHDPEKIIRWMGNRGVVGDAARQDSNRSTRRWRPRPQRGRAFREDDAGLHRLAYSFGWEGSELVPPGSSLVEIDLIDQDGGTLLRITHTGLPNAEQWAGHGRGWAHYLARLANRRRRRRSRSGSAIPSLVRSAG